MTCKGGKWCPLPGEAERGAGNRTDINHSLSASSVPEESTEMITERVAGQCLQQFEPQEGDHNTTAGPPERPEASPLNDRDIDGALCDYSDEEEVGTVAGTSSAPLAARVSAISSQQSADPAAPTCKRNS